MYIGPVTRRKSWFMIKLFDSHCHLQDERIVNDIEGIILRAQDAGVEKMVCCGSSEGDWRAVLSLADRFPLQIIPALGVHPWYVAEQSDGCLKRLEVVLENDSRIVVGEIGLDHALQQRDDALQMRFFHEQLLLAGRLRRPVSIHCRKAWGSLLELFRREPRIAENCVIHSYGGSMELIEELVRYGISFSFSGSVTYDRNRRGREAVRTVPLDRLLIESDSPDIPPADHTGNNEPATIVRVAETLAGLREMDIDEISRLTFSNGSRLFRR